MIVREDYFEKLLFKPKNIYLKEDLLELFVDTINWISPYISRSTYTNVILHSKKQN